MKKITLILGLIATFAFGPAIFAGIEEKTSLVENSSPIQAHLYGDIQRIVKGLHTSSHNLVERIQRKQPIVKKALNDDNNEIIVPGFEIQAFFDSLDELHQLTTILGWYPEEVGNACKAIKKLTEEQLYDCVNQDKALDACKDIMIMTNTLLASFNHAAVVTPDMLKNIEVEYAYYQDMYGSSLKVAEYLHNFDEIKKKYLENKEKLDQKRIEFTKKYNDTMGTIDKETKEALEKIENNKLKGLSHGLSWGKTFKYYGTFGYYSKDYLEDLQYKEDKAKIIDKKSILQKTYEDMIKEWAKKQKESDRRDLLAPWCQTVDNIYEAMRNVARFSDDKYKDFFDCMRILFGAARQQRGWFGGWFGAIKDLKENYIELKKPMGMIAPFIADAHKTVKEIKLDQTCNNLSGLLKDFNKDLEPQIREFLEACKNGSDVDWMNGLFGANKVYFLTTFAQFLITSGALKGCIVGMLGERGKGSVDVCLTVFQNIMSTLDKGGFGAKSMLQLVGLAGENNVAFMLRVAKHMLMIAKSEVKDKAAYTITRGKNISLQLVDLLEEAEQGIIKVENTLKNLSEDWLKKSLTTKDMIELLDSISMENRKYVQVIKDLSEDEKQEIDEQKQIMADFFNHAEGISQQNMGVSDSGGKTVVLNRHKHELRKDRIKDGMAKLKLLEQPKPEPQPLGWLESAWNWIKGLFGWKPPVEEISILDETIKAKNEALTKDRETFNNQINEYKADELDGSDYYALLEEIELEKVLKHTQKDNKDFDYIKSKVFQEHKKNTLKFFEKRSEQNPELLKDKEKTESSKDKSVDEILLDACSNYCEIISKPEMSEEENTYVLNLINLYEKNGKLEQLLLHKFAEGKTLYDFIPDDDAFEKKPQSYAVEMLVALYDGLIDEGKFKKNTFSSALKILEKKNECKEERYNSKATQNLESLYKEIKDQEFKFYEEKKHQELKEEANKVGNFFKEGNRKKALAVLKDHYNNAEKRIPLDLSSLEAIDNFKKIKDIMKKKEISEKDAEELDGLIDQVEQKNMFDNLSKVKSFGDNKWLSFIMSYKGSCTDAHKRLRDLYHAKVQNDYKNEIRQNNDKKLIPTGQQLNELISAKNTQNSVSTLGYWWNNVKNGVSKYVNSFVTHKDGFEVDTRQYVKISEKSRIGNSFYMLWDFILEKNSSKEKYDEMENLVNGLKKNDSLMEKVLRYKNADNKTLKDAISQNYFKSGKAINEINSWYMNNN